MPTGGLFDVDPNIPAGSTSPAQGSAEIRALKLKVREYAYLEHDYDGVHKILRGSLAQRPAVGRPGRLFILLTPNQADELQYDTGGAWVGLSQNQNLIDNIASLTTHKAANPLDHPDSSVTTAKIANAAVTSDKIPAGGILKKHLDGSTSNTSLAALVGGGNADALHIHSTPSALTLVTSGVNTFSHTTYGTNVAVNDVIAIPLGVTCSTVKKYLVVARPYIHGGPNVGTDDSLSWDLTVEGKIVEKLAYTAPQSGNGDYGGWATYNLSLSATGTYTMTYAGSAGPTYLNIDVYYAVYEVN